MQQVSPDEIYKMRGQSFQHYKRLCHALFKIKNQIALLKAAICVLQQEPSDRQDFELQLLEKATADLEFFKQLGDVRLHQSCCKMMKLRTYRKNEIIFKQGEPSTEFFIIIDGTANVYTKKSEERIQQELHNDKIYQKSLSQEDKMKHSTYIIDNFQPPRKQPKIQRRFTINLTDEDFQKYHFSIINVNKQISLGSLVNIKQNPETPTESYDVEVLKKITNGLDRIWDQDFLFHNGIFLHDFQLALQDGNMFGERGILIESKRTGTVIATSFLHVAYLTKQEYKAVIEDNQLEKIRKKIRLLCKHFLSKATYKEAIQCQYLFEKVKYPLGFRIYRTNDTTSHIYIIRKGAVRVYRTINEKLTPMYELGMEQYFGDIEYFEQCSRYHTVDVISTNFKAFVISIDDLRKLLYICPQVQDMLKSLYEQRKIVDSQRYEQQVKGKKKQLLAFLKQDKIVNMQNMNLPVSMMEQIEQTSKNLKLLRRKQKKAINETQSVKQESLAETLIKLEKQQQIFRRDLRRKEQQRYSSLDKIDRSNNSIQTSQIQQDFFYQDQIKESTPTNSVIISSKHNLFRQKPTKIFLYSHYERRQPKTYSSEISMKSSLAQLLK